MEAEVMVKNRNRMPDMAELLKILMVAEKFREGQQINYLLDQMNGLEGNYAAIMQELADIKAQLDTVLNRMDEKSDVHQKTGILSRLVTQSTEKAAEQYHKLQDIRQDLNAKAKSVVENFKNVGTKALNNVCGFLGVQEKLTEMRDHARSAAMEMGDTAEKIGAVEKELTGALAQVRNAGRIASGKEMTLSEEQAASDKVGNKGISVLRMFKEFCQKRQNAYTQRAEKLDKAIEKMSALEQRGSVIEKLSDNKERLSSENKSEDRQLPATNQREVSEHKRDDGAR